MAVIARRVTTLAAVAPKPKLVWVAGTAPVGKYRSFSKRPWPTCFLGSKDGPMVAAFRCEEEYNPKKAEEIELTPVFYDISNGVQKRRTLVAKKTVKGLKAAKKAVESYLTKHPELLPK